jgi:hypothetical protein
MAETVAFVVVAVELSPENIAITVRVAPRLAITGDVMDSQIFKE